MKRNEEIVRQIRKLSQEANLTNKEIYFPKNNKGIVEGYHRINDMLQYIGNMLEK